MKSLETIKRDEAARAARDRQLRPPRPNREREGRALKRPKMCDMWAAVDQFRALFEEHEAECGYAAAMASCYEFAIDSGVLPTSEHQRAAELEEKGDDDA